MFALLATISFAIGMIVSKPDADTWNFWFELGLIMWALAFSILERKWIRGYTVTKRG